MTKVSKKPLPFSFFKTIFAIQIFSLKLRHGGFQHNDELVFQEAINVS